MQYEDHELAAIFPLMSDAELASLAEDIESNGLRDAVWLFEGKILDGRNRYRACQLKDVDPRFETYRGKDPLGFVVSKNLHRRHLTESQRAMVAARIAKAKAGDNQHKEVGVNLPRPTNAQAADLLGISTETLKHAKTVQTHGAPELIAAVDAGEASVSAAAEVAKLPKAEQKKAVKDGTVAEKAKQQRKKKAKPTAPPAPSVPTSDGASADDADADEREPEGDGQEAEQPPAVDPADAFVERVESLCRQIDRINAEVAELKKDRLSFSMHVDSAVAQIKAARSTLWQGRPCHACPYCRVNETDGCKACCMTKRVSKRIYDAGVEAVGGAV